MFKKIARFIPFFLIMVLIFCALVQAKGTKADLYEVNSPGPMEIRNDEKKIIRASDLEVNEVEVRNYYYRQLNDFEKIIYEAFVDSRDKFLNGERIDIIRFHNEEDIEGYEKYVEKAWKAYLYDYPLASIYASSIKAGTEAKKVFDRDNNEIIIEYRILFVDVPDGSLTYSEFDTPERTLEALKQVELTAIGFTRNLEGTDEEKLRAIHDFLITGRKYDETLVKPNIRNPYGVLINNNAVCAGYSYSFKYLCDLADLKCIYVAGNGDNGFTSGNHSWNHVFIDGEWKLVDVTFDLNSYLKIVMTEKEEDISSGKFYESNTYQFLYEDNLAFFMIPIEDEIQIGRHVPDNGFKYQ